MLYIIDIFKCRYGTQTPGFKGACINALHSDDFSRDDHFQLFDVPSVTKKIQTCLGTTAHHSGYLASIKHKIGKYSEVGWLQLATTPALAGQVIEKVMGIIHEYDLVLFDRQNYQATWRKDDLSNKPMAQAAMRAIAINENIRTSKLGVFSVHEVENVSRYSTHSISYVLTLRHWHGLKTLEDRVCDFHAILTASLVNGEVLMCENKCFSVQNESYAINYVLEAYAKQASRLCYFELGQPKVFLIKRMGVDFAFRTVSPDRKSSKWRCFWQRLNTIEFIANYPNPADRFVANIGMEKRLKKISLGIQYGLSSEGPNGEVSLYRLNSTQFFAHGDYTASALGLTEEAATLFLPLIQECYPYIKGRFYGINPLPHELWWDVIEKMRKLVHLICCDPFADELDEYVKNASIAVLRKGCFSDSFGYPAELIDGVPDWVKNRKAFLYKHRHRLIDFFNFLEEWIDEQGQSLIVFDGP